MKKAPAWVQEQIPIAKGTHCRLRPAVHREAAAVLYCGSREAEL